MAQISPFSLPGRFWRGNIHTHSTLSDGALRPEQIVEAYKKVGYDFMTISDHFLERFNWPIVDTTAFRSDEFTTIIGAELHTPETSVGEYGTGRRASARPVLVRRSRAGPTLDPPDRHVR